MSDQADFERAAIKFGIGQPPSDFHPEMWTKVDLDGKELRLSIIRPARDIRIGFGYILSTPDRREEMRAMQPEKDAELRVTMWRAMEISRLAAEGNEDAQAICAEYDPHITDEEYIP